LVQLKKVQHVITKHKSHLNSVAYCETWPGVGVSLFNYTVHKPTQRSKAVTNYETGLNTF